MKQTNLYSRISLFLSSDERLPNLDLSFTHSKDWEYFNKTTEKSWKFNECRPMRKEAYLNYKGIMNRNRGDHHHIMLFRKDKEFLLVPVWDGGKSFCSDMMRYVLEKGHSKSLLKNQNKITKFMTWWDDHLEDMEEFLMGK